MAKPKPLAYEVSETDCWICISHSTQSQGYAQRYDPETKRATTLARLAFKLAYGPVAANVQVRRTCHDKRCVNPSHLTTRHAKRCSGCKWWLPKSAFYQERDRLSSLCRACKRARMSTYNKNYYQSRKVF